MSVPQVIKYMCSANSSFKYRSTDTHLCLTDSLFNAQNVRANFPIASRSHASVKRRISRYNWPVILFPAQFVRPRAISNNCISKISTTILLTRHASSLLSHSLPSNSRFFDQSLMMLRSHSCHDKRAVCGVL